MNTSSSWRQLVDSAKQTQEQKKEEALRRFREATGEEPPQDPEIVEASDRCGMDSRHSLPGLVLVETETGDEIGIHYMWICSPVRFIATRGVVFRFEDEEGVHEVEITGDGSEASTEKLRMISRQICWSKRALLWANGGVVKQIRIERLEEEEAQ